MSTTRSPFVYWGQDKTRIFFRVDIKEAKDVIAQIKDEDTKKIEFYASDFTDQKYHFDLNLANNIKKFIEVNVKESKVELVLTKAEESDWNALIEKTANNSRTPLWLKIDFDRWKPDDSTEDEAEKSNPSVCLVF